MRPPKGDRATLDGAAAHTDDGGIRRPCARIATRDWRDDPAGTAAARAVGDRSSRDLETVVEGSIATWHLRRLTRLAGAPCRYGRWDTVNAYLAARGLIADTGRAAGTDRREYAITEAGRAALAEASETVAAFRTR